MHRLRPNQWAVWRLPPVAILWLAMSLGLALVFLATTDERWGDYSSSTWWQFAIILGAGILHTEISKSIEYTRKYFDDVAHVTMTIIWVFAAVIILPLPLVAILKAVLHTHVYLRSWSHMSRMKPHRVVFNVSAAIVTAFVTQLLVPLGDPVASLTDPSMSWRYLAAIAVYFILSNGSVAVIIRLTTAPRPIHQLFVNKVDLLLDLSTLALGFCAAFLVVFQPAMILLIVLLATVIHRGVLVKQMEELALTDGKTGLRNAAAWHQIATRETERAYRAQTQFAVIMVDLDHFKKVNDTYGHLAGDEVLKAVAQILKSEIRTYDTAGRFGGEEFAVLIPDSTAADAIATAERIRQRIRHLTVKAVAKDGAPLEITELSASLGVAVFPTSGDTVERLLLTADNALYIAKNNGRDQVVAIDKSGTELLRPKAA